MEIEHINEDTIRVLINNTDLEARGYTFLDLLGNQEQIEKFFYSILEEVDLEDEFKESEAVTFQVMPNPNGLELLISKNQEVHDSIAASAEARNQELFIEGNEHDLIEDEFSKEDEMDEQESTGISEDKEIVIEFKVFEQLVQLAQKVKTINGFSSLYLYKGKYYLDFHLIRDDLSLRSFEEKLAMILDYGGETKLNGDILAEHGKLLMQEQALEQIHHYFK